MVWGVRSSEGGWSWGKASCKGGRPVDQTEESGNLSRGGFSLPRPEMGMGSATCYSAGPDEMI